MNPRVNRRQFPFIGALALRGGRDTRPFPSPEASAAYIRGQDVDSSNGGRNISFGASINDVTSSGTSNTVAGGGATSNPNVISGGNYNTITGGYDQRITSVGVGASVISGGAHSRIENQVTHATVAGGSYHRVTAGDYGTIGGGTSNSVQASGATIAGGRLNSASGQDASILGGVSNSATAQNATVVSGFSNSARGVGAVVLGGSTNTAVGRNSSVVGGLENELGGPSASADYATISGGLRNRVGTVSNARFAAISGGRELDIQHEYVHAFGYQAVSRMAGAQTMALGSFGAAGDGQSHTVVLRAFTSTTSPAFLAPNAAAPPVLPTGTSWLVSALVVGRSGSGQFAVEIKGLVARDTGAVAVVGTPSVTVIGAQGSAGWAVTLSGGRSSLDLGVSGSSTPTRWVARAVIVEVAA